MLPHSLKNLHCWFPGYVEHRRKARAQERLRGPLTVWLMIADHFEPYWRRPDDRTARMRVAQWRNAWPKVAARHRDGAGRSPQYTFFYAEEEYRPDLVEPLAEMTRCGIADVEVHIHHDGEGEQDFVRRMRAFIETLHVRHGLLREHERKLAFGFIHGNWALDNSRPDGRWCGLNNELALLRDLGCYGDFTLPSAPSPTQTRMVNTVYWATDDPKAPKSHNSGVPVVPGRRVTGDLLLIPGPLGFNSRGGRLLPRLETGELASYDPPVRGRARSWMALAPRIDNHLFVKLSTHGTQEDNSAMLLGGGLDRLFDDISEECARSRHILRFATAWEVRQAVDAAALPKVETIQNTCIS